MYFFPISLSKCINVSFVMYVCLLAWNINININSTGKKKVNCTSKRCPKSKFQFSNKIRWKDRGRVKKKQKGKGWATLDSMKGWDFLLLLVKSSGGEEEQVMRRRWLIGRGLKVGDLGKKACDERERCRPTGSGGRRAEAATTVDMPPRSSRFLSLPLFFVILDLDRLVLSPTL